MALQLSVSQTADTLQIVVDGEVDVSNAHELRDYLEEQLQGDAPLVVIDAAQLSYIDSTGIGVLVGCAHRLSETHRRLNIQHVQPHVLRILNLLGLAEELGVS